MSTFKRVMQLGGQGVLFDALRLGNGCGADIISSVVRGFEKRRLPVEVLFLLGSLPQEQQDEIFGSVAERLVEIAPPAVENVDVPTPKYDANVLFTFGRDSNLSVSLRCSDIPGVRNIICIEPENDKMEAVFGIFRFWKDMPVSQIFSMIRSMGYKAPSLSQLCSLGVWMHSSHSRKMVIPPIKEFGRRAIILPTVGETDILHAVLLLVDDSIGNNPSLHPARFAADKWGIGLSHSFIAVKKD